MKTRHKMGFITSVVTLLLAFSGVAAIAADGSGVPSQLAEVRRATTQFHDVQAAMDAGYVLASECVPGMGYHYLLDIADGADDLDHESPNILVYAPRPDGGLRLVAVEYASWADDAELFGHGFDAGGTVGPPFATLHAWVWQHNPHGTFVGLNPNVRC